MPDRMKRFLLAPLAALAVSFIVVAPTSAQADPTAEFIQLRYDHHQMHKAYDKLEHQIKRCQMPETSDVQHVLTSANDISRRAGELAWRLGGTRHAQTLTMQRVAEEDFYWANHLQYLLPDDCYVLPTE